MPPPRSRSYATPEEAFGITQRPLNDWFDAAASGLTRSGPAFSQSFEDATLRNQQRELESERLRRQLESEQAASAFLQRAAGEKPDALMQMIAEDPAILGSQDAPMIRDYIATRQQVQQQKQAQQPYSNKVLGPAIMKSLPPADQARLQRRIDETGKNIVDAYEELEQEKKTAAQRAELNTKRLGLLAKGFDTNLVNEAAASENPLEAFAIIEGSKKAGGDEDMSLKDLVGLKKSIYESGEEPDPDLLKWIDGQIRLKTVGAPPIQNQPAGAAKAPPSGETAAIPADLQLEPLSPFEQEQSTAVSPSAQRRKALEAEWTGAKQKPVEALVKDTNIKPERLVSLSQSALLGQPIEDASKQEQEMAKMIAQYALRTVEGKPIQVGVDYGEGGVTPRLQNPAIALLERMGVDPFEDIKIPGGGIMGGDKKTKAWELMELRLKEIAKPLESARKQQQMMTPEVQTSYEKLKAQAQGLTPTQP